MKDLYKQVEKGKGQQAYPYLLAAYRAMNQSWDKGDRPDAMAELSVYTLLAGEEAANPVDQELRARLFMARFPRHEQFPLAYFLLIDSLYRQGKDFDITIPLDNRTLEALPSWMRSRLLLMLADISRKKGQSAEEAGYLFREMDQGGSNAQTTENEVLAALGRISRQQELDDFFSKYKAGWLKNERDVLEARVLLNSGEWDKARRAFQEVEENGSARAAMTKRFVSEARQELDSLPSAKPERIGVLLPLGSKDPVIRGLANSLLDGIRLAIHANPAIAKPKNNYEILIRDTQNNPGLAAQLTDELVHQDQVSVIIGPLTRAETAAAAARAEELMVPLITFSLTYDAEGFPEYTFRQSMRPEDEIGNLVRYAMDFRNAKRFVVVYPDNNYGRNMMEMFWKEAVGHGGKMVGAASYTPPDKRLERAKMDFKDVFGHLAGLDRYVSSADQQLMLEVGDRRPDPIVDFDAIFIPIPPEGAQDLEAIASYPVTVDAEKALLLGTRNWNQNQTLLANNGSMNGAIFVDTFDSLDRSPLALKFRGDHRIAYGHRPDYQAPDYFTAVGYDTAALLTLLAENPKNRSRRRMARALKDMEPYPGLTGITRFRADGQADKRTRVYSIKGQRVSPV
ncbi:MAG: penicillin-binding protein activator, partial [Deltaproteobacteria bacterium]|nr:penicillin-binding protein activator [Deltaproteobacteria bacterium]